MLYASTQPQNSERRLTPRPSAVKSPDIDPSTKIPRFGVALPDYPTDIDSNGWAYVFGEDSARRYSTLAELPNDAILVTNHERLRPGLRVARNIRGSTYLSRSLKQIADDLGHSIDGAASADIAIKLGRIVHYAGMTAISAYGWSSPMDALASSTLAEDIRKTLKPDQAAPELVDHMVSAYQSWSSVNWPYASDRDMVNVTLRLNRLHYARKLMSYPAPAGAWTYMPVGGRSRGIDQWIDPSAPCLVEATVEFADTDPEMAVLLAIGSSAQGGALRKWFTSVELSWLSRFATINVNSVLSNDAMIEPAPRTRLPEALTKDPLLAMSPAAGLVAECHWAALATPAYDPKTRMRNAIGPHGIWLRAHDRRLCFERALYLHQHGFKVNGYGNGAVLVKSERARLPELMEVADVIEAQYPVFTRLFQEHGIA